MKLRVAFVFSHPAHFLACGLGSGLSPFAPGTAGTLLAWLMFPWLHTLLTDAQMLGALVIAFVVGVLACDRTGRDLGVADHGGIVWDEMVPFWLVLTLAPHGIAWQLAAFLLFRVFDIVKPPPAGWIDGSIKNGFGVMLDDLVAAGYTLLCLAAAKRLIVS